MTMSSVLSPLGGCGLPAFDFAGFHWPRYVARLPRGPLAKRLQDRKPVVCGEYYHAPAPISGKHPGKGFYLDSDGMPGLRWQWADEVVSLHHTRWFTDEYGDRETVRGIVLRLPHGRGFLAGWSMGAGMASECDGFIYQDAESAAYAADGMAESVAEDERECRAQQETGEEF